MENQNEIYVKIFVGVKFAEKEMAKQNGAKWDKETKAWYFKFILSEFLEDEQKHTCQFKPFRIHISHLYSESFGDFQRCYNIAEQRNIKFTEEACKIMNTVIY